MKDGWLYIVASKRNGTLYLGVTSDLPTRIWQHRVGAVEGFTKKYGCKHLVWCEHFENLHDAREREWQMKKWKRAWKIELIEKDNPGWRDLWHDINR
ncbi:GIY-YIG nuclease family protein [Qipengyuania qiaonensis]|uniref:GIY-YIG nuclease family protein n=1 Tax=Qipengyuania qiaonensis TaxID=2867240 RepID=A0ABS7J5T2_9SPHN|nr:GIY-YIG nuclease family protein [Qipengyuania qiaonensis]